MVVVSFGRLMVFALSVTVDAAVPPGLYDWDAVICSVPPAGVSVI